MSVCGVGGSKPLSPNLTCFFYNIYEWNIMYKVYKLFKKFIIDGNWILRMARVWFSTFVNVLEYYADRWVSESVNRPVVDVYCIL